MKTNIKKLSKEVNAADVKVTKTFKKMELAQREYSKAANEYNKLYAEYREELGKLPEHP